MMHVGVTNIVYPTWTSAKQHKGGKAPGTALAARWPQPSFFGVCGSLHQFLYPQAIVTSLNDCLLNACQKTHLRFKRDLPTLCLKNPCFLMGIVQSHAGVIETRKELPIVLRPGDGVLNIFSLCQALAWQDLMGKEMK